MKQLFTICSALVITVNMFAQAPNKMSYQAVIRNSSNALVTNQGIGMRISILQGSSSGTAVYVETQAPSTNANGLVNIEIGGGTVISGNFVNIDWTSGNYFVKTETDLLGGTNYTITGTSQLLSVPYALHAKNTDSWINLGGVVYNSKYVSIGSNNPAIECITCNEDIGVLIKDTLAARIHLITGTQTNSQAMVNFEIGNNNRWITAARGVNYSQNSGRQFGDLIFANYDGSNWSYPLVLDRNKNVGINTEEPQRALHVNDIMRIEPRTSAPASPSKGDIYFDGTINKLRVYDGTTWQNCW